MDDAKLSDLHVMTAEMLATTRMLAPTIVALDNRLDQVEKTNIKLEATLTQLATHEERIKSLEEDRTKLKAWAALIAFLGSIGAFLVGKFWPK